MSEGQEVGIEEDKSHRGDISGSSVPDVHEEREVKPVTGNREDKLLQLMEMMLTGLKEDRKSRKRGVMDQARVVDRLFALQRWS